MAEFTNMYMQRLGHKHCNFMWAGGYMGSWMQAGHAGLRQELRARGRSTASTATRRAIKLVECGGDALMGCGSTIGGGGYCGLEQFVSYDPADNDSIEACIKHMEDAVDDCRRTRNPAGQGVHVPAGRMDRRKGLRRLGEDAAAVHLQLPAQDQGRLRSQLTSATGTIQWLPEGWGQTETKAETAKEAEALKR